MAPSNDNLESLVKELSDSIHEINSNTRILVTKLEQVNSNIEKLEASVDDLHSSLSEQDRRLTILEQVVPQDLTKDIVILKQSVGIYSRLLWLVAGIALTTFGNMLYRLLTK